MTKSQKEHRRWRWIYDFTVHLSIEVYEYRKEHRLSQSAFAKKIETTQRIVSMIENGDYFMGIELLSRICLLLGKKIKLIDNHEQNTNT